MKKRQFLVFAVLCLFASLVLVSCGGGGAGGGGGPQPPVYNLAGIWNTTETEGADNCGGLGGTTYGPYPVTIDHSEGSNSLIMTDFDVVPITATVSGANVAYSESGTDGYCGSYSWSLNVTASSANAMSGTVGWTCGPCSGTDSISMTRPAPTITSFSPTSGQIGALVTITGTNFSSTASSITVKFNDATALVTSSTTTMITTSVPTGASTGKITVTVGDKTATSAANFTVTGVPAILSFSPTSGVVTTSVTITGTGFSTTAANNTVKFNNVTALVTSSTATTITTSVPATATTGKITVTVGGVTGTSATKFGVITAAGNTYTSTDVPKSIPDSDLVTGASSTVTVSGGPASIAKVTVTLSITHTYDADLNIYLISPDGTQIELSTDNGGSLDNYTNTTFDDNVATSITTGTAPFSGTYRPEATLSALHGKNADGTWTLRIYDDVGIDVGSLSAWSIGIE